MISAYIVVSADKSFMEPINIREIAVPYPYLFSNMEYAFNRIETIQADECPPQDYVVLKIAFTNKNEIIELLDAGLSQDNTVYPKCIRIEKIYNVRNN